MQLEPRDLQFLELHLCEQIQLRAHGPCLGCRILPAFARARLHALHGQVDQRQHAPVPCFSSVRGSCFCFSSVRGLCSAILLPPLVVGHNLTPLLSLVPCQTVQESTWRHGAPCFVLELFGSSLKVPLEWLDDLQLLTLEATKYGAHAKDPAQLKPDMQAWL